MKVSIIDKDFIRFNIGLYQTIVSVKEARDIMSTLNSLILRIERRQCKDKERGNK